MFKRQFLFISIVLICFSTIWCSSPAICQSMPAFKMQLTNGKIFSSTELSRQRPVIIIYFAPDCDHCQVLMKELLKKMAAFKNSQIVMATFERVNEVAGFEKLYQISKFPNIQAGSEIPVFFFRNYYRLEHTPFTALYDKQGKLVVAYKDQTPVDDLIKRLKTLQ